MSDPSKQNIQDALEQGEYELRGQFLLGSNYTFLVDVRHKGKTYQAVYKPCKGEQPLWDFPDNTLAQREVAAYLLSEDLGLHIVPVTVMREEGPYGRGSLQQYIHYDVEYHYFNFSEEDRDRLRPVVLFDLLVNNADRKGSHVFFEEDSHALYAIDHGVCFHEENKLRTVIWDFAGQPVPEELLAPLADTGRWSALFANYLSLTEVTAMQNRAQKIFGAKIFPQAPSDRRAFPYPPL